MQKSWFSKLTFALIFIILGMVFSLGIFLFWVKNYPNADDPKNIDYVLWKQGLNENMNLDAATRAMTHDTRPTELVIDLSKVQIEKRFGYLRAPEGNRYGCSPSSGNVGMLGISSVGKDAVYLRDSQWMVILDHGKAVDLVFCKG